MDLRLLCLGFMVQTAEFGCFLFYLDVITKEEGCGEESKSGERENDLEGFFWNFEMPSSGSLRSKDKDAIVLFVQNAPPCLKTYEPPWKIPSE